MKLISYSFYLCFLRQKKHLSFFSFILDFSFFESKSFFFSFCLWLFFLVLVSCIHRSGAIDRNIGKDLGSYTVLWDQPLLSTHTPFLLIFSVSFFFFQFSLSLSYTSICLCVAMLNKDPKSKSCHVCYNKPNPSISLTLP